MRELGEWKRAVLPGWWVAFSVTASVGLSAPLGMDRWEADACVGYVRGRGGCQSVRVGRAKQFHEMVEASDGAHTWAAQRSLSNEK